jgi:hypothetical protein
MGLMGNGQEREVGDDKIVEEWKMGQNCVRLEMGRFHGREWRKE